MDSLSPKPYLREQFRVVIRVNHYSIRTEKSYWYWIRYFIRYHKMRHPLELGPAEVNTFLSWLATDRHVAAATRNLALNAIVSSLLYARGFRALWANTGTLPLYPLHGHIGETL